MASGIYAVANFGTIHLYVGEVKHLKTRWPKMMAQLEQGIFPEPEIQQVWNTHGRDRRFTFHTAEQIKSDGDIRGHRLFLKDRKKRQASVSEQGPESAAGADSGTSSVSPER